MNNLINSKSKFRAPNIIDGFPEELLVKIFGFLDWTTPVKTLTLVNKRWYDIVTNDISKMKRLTLTICGDLSRKDHLTLGNWKFYKVVFKSINKSLNKDMLSKLTTIGAYVHEIEFIECSVHDPKVFQNILRNFLKVEKLTFLECMFRNHLKISDTDVLELENLKELVFKQHSLMLLGYIGAQLKSFVVVKLKNYYPYKPVVELVDEQLLMNFLYTQKRLETLELFNIHALTQVFAKKENSEFQFKLKKLSLHRIRYEEGFSDDNLKEFINTQKESIEILELGSTFSKDLYELILSKFKNVKTLCISISTFPTDLIFYERIKVNKNVTKLHINGGIANNSVYCAFLRLFPNVTDIRFPGYTKVEVLSHLPYCCNALTSLSLSCLLPGNYKYVKFPALKNLHLECDDEDYEGENEWIGLLMSNQTVESLSFGWRYVESDFGPYEIQFICDALPNLKHLKFGNKI